MKTPFTFLLMAVLILASLPSSSFAQDSTDKVAKGNSLPFPSRTNPKFNVENYLTVADSKTGTPHADQTQTGGLPSMPSTIQSQPPEAPKKKSGVPDVAGFVVIGIAVAVVVGFYIVFDDGFSKAGASHDS